MKEYLIPIAPNEVISMQNIGFIEKDEYFDYEPDFVQKDNECCSGCMYCLGFSWSDFL